MYRVFTKKGCGTCNSVKAILRSRGVEFSEVDVSTEAGLYLARKLGVMHSGAIVDENDHIISIEEIAQRSSMACATC